MNVKLIIISILLTSCTNYHTEYIELTTPNGIKVTCQAPNPCKRGTILFNCSDGRAYKCW